MCFYCQNQDILCPKKGVKFNGATALQFPQDDVIIHAEMR